MRLTRVRFRIRRMMIAVAILALFIGADQLRRRSIRYRQMATRFDQLETATRSLQRTVESRSQWQTEWARSQIEGWGPFNDDQHRASVVAQTKDGVEAEYLRQDAIAYAADADWFSRLRSQYERAASHPWEPLPALPPRPAVKIPFRPPR